MKYRYPHAHRTYNGRDQMGQTSAFPGLSGPSGGPLSPEGADVGFGAASGSTSLIPSESKGPFSLDKLNDIKGFIDRMGGIDGIVSTMGKVQKMVSSFQQMAPMFKLIMGTFGKGATTTASDDEEWVEPIRRTRRRRRPRGTGTARRPSGTRRRNAGRSGNRRRRTSSR